MKGFITKVNAGLYDVYANEKTYTCKARGKFRIGEYSPLVGDEVDFDEVQNYLLKIHPRTNHFSRPPIANVDQVAIVASLKNPVIPLSLITRFAMISKIAGITPKIIFTKFDLVDDESYKDTLASLDKLGYDKYIMSEVTFVPDNYIALDEENTEKMMSLIEALEDIDDVQNVYHNMDV